MSVPYVHIRLAQVRATVAVSPEHGPVPGGRLAAVWAGAWAPIVP